MGWVEQKITDHKTTAGSLTPLWNSLRDSIGCAVAEFKSLVSQPGIDHGDCTARGTLCVRVQKPGWFMEIFLSKPDQTVRAVIQENGTTQNGEALEICRYRMNKDRSDLEFSVANESASADDVAKLAIEKFLFDPFPEKYLRPEKV